MAKSIALKRAYLLTAFIAMTFSQIGCDTQLTESTGSDPQPWPEQPTPWHQNQAQQQDQPAPQANSTLVANLSLIHI